MKLAIVFPGIGYHVDKPLLYYARKLAKENGYQEIICLNYSYQGKNIRGNEKKMQEAFEILYTPLEQTYQYEHKDAIAFLGNKDPWSDVEVVKQLSAKQEIIINDYEDADHSLETTNTMQNIEILKDVMYKTERYIQREEEE